MQEYYSIKQLAELLQVSTKLLYRLVNTGKLKGVKIGGATRISQQALQVYLSTQQILPFIPPQKVIMPPKPSMVYKFLPPA